METLMGFMGAALALMAIFLLYIGGTTIVLRFFERLSPTKHAPLQDADTPSSAS